MCVQVYDSINSKLNLRFDSFSLQEDISPVNLCAIQAINLSLTNGNKTKLKTENIRKKIIIIKIFI